MNTETKIKEAEGVGLRATPGSPMVVLPVGTDTESVNELRAAGLLVVLSDNPDGVRLISADLAMPSSDVIMSALRALQGGGSNIERSVFLSELYERLTDREANNLLSRPEL